MVDSYLNPQIISFINYFYYFIQKYNHNIEMDICIISNAYNKESKMLKVTLTLEKKQIYKCYNTKNIEFDWILDYIEDEVGDLVIELFHRTREVINGKIET